MWAMKRTEVLPSLLSMDFSCMKHALASMPENIHMLHLDIMDGHFVDNITMGPFIIKWIRQNTALKLDAHLMISDPSHYMDRFIDAGIDLVSFHIETVDDAGKLIAHIKDKGVKAGIALNPDTDIETVKPYIGDIDYVLVMSVFPGFAGQSFIHDVLNKVRILKTMQEQYDFAIEIDGGINGQTAPLAVKSGANWIVTGSYLFSSDDMARTAGEIIDGH